MLKRFPLMSILLAVFLFCGCSSDEIPSSGSSALQPAYRPSEFVTSYNFDESYPAESESVDSDSFIFEESSPVTEDDEADISDETEETTDYTAEITETVTSAEEPEAYAEVTTAAVTVIETTVTVTSAAPESAAIPSGSIFAVINTSSGKYHLDKNCRAVKNMNTENKLERSFKSIAVMEAAGYTPCGLCSKDGKLPDVTSAKETSAVAVTSGITESSESFNAVINTNSKKIHLDAECRYVKTMKEENRRDEVLLSDDIKAMLGDGYSLCKSCSD